MVTAAILCGVATSAAGLVTRSPVLAAAGAVVHVVAVGWSRGRGRGFGE